MSNHEWTNPESIGVVLYTISAHLARGVIGKFCINGTNYYTTSLHSLTLGISHDSGLLEILHFSTYSQQLTVRPFISDATWNKVQKDLWDAYQEALRCEQEREKEECATINDLFNGRGAK